ncbi:MAG TPA: cell division protein FtsZ [Firmicutes bacterium]|nr:cell division protein FtsZ [Bacillota bacterium]
MSENKDVVTPSSKIAVVGVGGGGGNAVNRMMDDRFAGVDFIAINTDLQDLHKSKAPIRIQIGEKLTQGLGAGANPDVGQKAAEESREIIKRYLQNANLVIITAGMGKGTGTGASPVVASIAKELGKLVVAVVTKPFYLEGRHRIVNAEIGIENLSRVVDSYIVVSNEKLVSLSNHASMADAFAYADGVLRQCILGISDVILNTQTLNIDFADLCTVLRNMGRAYLGIGSGSGDNRVMTAVREAVGITLQDTKISNATSVMLYVKAKRDVTLEEIDKAAVLVKEVVHKDANIIFGFDFRDDLPHDVEIMLIATGLGQTADKNRPKQPQQPVAPEYADIIGGAPRASEIIHQADPVDERPARMQSSRVRIDDDDDDDVPAWLKETNRSGRRDR